MKILIRATENKQRGRQFDMPALKSQFLSKIEKCLVTGGWDQPNNVTYIFEWTLRSKIMNNFFVYTYFGLFNIGSMFRQVLHLTHCIWKGNIHQAYNDPEWKTKFLALNKETQQRIKNKIFKKITSKYGTFLKFYFDFSSLSPYNFYIEIKKTLQFL